MTDMILTFDMLLVEVVLNDRDQLVVTLNFFIHKYIEESLYLLLKCYSL